MKFQIRHHFDDDNGNNGYFLNCFPVTVIKHHDQGDWAYRGVESTMVEWRQQLW